MAGIYTIGSKLGYDLANGMDAGDTVRATDGSQWTKNADGSISVLHNGQQMIGQITYRPTQQELRPTAIAGMGASVPQYSSPYNSQLQSILTNLTTAKYGGYDYETDPRYQAYRKEYLREADRTMEDTMARYAQNTGGIAGSAAMAAASQAADYYKSQLNDKIPELADSDYSRWLEGQQLQMNNAKLLLSADEQANSQYYQRISYAMQKWAQMGYADQEVASILGVTPGTATSDQAYNDWQQAFKEAAAEEAAAGKTSGSSGGGSKSSGGGSGSSGGGSSTNSMSKQDYILTYLQLRENAGYSTNYVQHNGNAGGIGAEEYLQNLVKEGVLTSLEAKELREGRQTAASYKSSMK